MAVIPYQDVCHLLCDDIMTRITAYDNLKITKTVSSLCWPASVYQCWWWGRTH